MIKIMPLEHIQENNINTKLNSSKNSSLDDILQADYLFTNSGKEAIHIIIKNEQLVREDEVFITTTTDTSFVSTCVSATIFNYCKISRVLTEKTKLIYVIHNFGFSHPDLIKLRKIANDRNIVLVEDCAFAFDSYNKNIRLGSVGDYAIYSLPKIFPLESGGILQYNKEIRIDYTTLKIDLSKYLSILDDLKTKRQQNYNFLASKIQYPSIYGDLNNENPFMYGFIHKDSKIINQQLNKICQCGLTYVDDEVHIPVNPFINTQDYEEILNIINKEQDYGV